MAKGEGVPPVTLLPPPPLGCLLPPPPEDPAACPAPACCSRCSVSLEPVSATPVPGDATLVGLPLPRRPGTEPPTVGEGEGVLEPPPLPPEDPLVGAATATRARPRSPDTRAGVTPGGGVAAVPRRRSTSWEGRGRGDRGAGVWGGARVCRHQVLALPRSPPTTPTHRTPSTAGHHLDGCGAQAGPALQAVQDELAHVLGALLGHPA